MTTGYDNWEPGWRSQEQATENERRIADRWEQEDRAEPYDHKAGWRVFGFGRGPEERAAQARLDVLAQTSMVASQEEAERLSDDVWAARERDHAAATGRHREMTVDPAEFVAFDPAAPGGFRELTDTEAQTLRDTPTTEAYNARGVEIDHGYPGNRDGEALRDAADWAAAGGRFDEADSADRLAEARVGEPHTEQLSWDQLAHAVQDDLARDDPAPRIDPPAADIGGRDLGAERDL